MNYENVAPKTGPLHGRGDRSMKLGPTILGFLFAYNRFFTGKFFTTIFSCETSKMTNAMIEAITRQKSVKSFKTVYQPNFLSVWMKV